MTNDARDELAERIAGRILVDLGPIVTDHDANDAAHNIASLLDELGYAKPRQVTTVEELDALPDMSVIMPVSEGDSYQKYDGEWFIWGGGGCDAEDLALPATVLYSPVVVS